MYLLEMLEIPREYLRRNDVFFFENTLVLKSLPFVTLTGTDRSD